MSKVDSKISVLDHGYVRLIDSMGTDLSVVRSARVSYDAEWRAGLDQGSDARLIKYLADNNHTTPFESVEFQFEVMLPIFSVRQWHRSRTWSYNEVSARYKELPEVFYVPELGQITMQSTDNKQMRTEVQHPEAAGIQSSIHHSCLQSFKTYKELLNRGTPRELARSVLPMGTYTHMFAKVDMLNLIKFLQQRLHPHAQHEIKVYAEAMVELARPIAPVSFTAWLD